ncbi:MAG: hypothetical protein LBB28_04705 [Synergistaceae bacterium]|jgi:hypothetical protein|nr:hypothetical protein [Synergistaceae bacterium]
MSHILRKFSGALAAAVILASFCASSGYAAGREKFKYVPFVPSDPIMPLSEVKPGMKGECYTVIKGSDVISFQAEVIDVIPSGGNPKNLILIKVSGKAVEETGIAAGMSGSPFYIRDRLVGAIGYGWNFTDHDKGLVTPIEVMMEIWNNPEIIPSFSPAPAIAVSPPSASDDVADSGKPRGIVSEDAVPNGVIIEEVLPASGDKTASRDIAVSSGDRAGIFVTGVSRRMADRITGLVGQNAAPFGGSPDGAQMPVRYGVSVKPGMAVGAMVLWGDVEIGSVGTLTAVSKDGRFIAYAHPFMSLGPTAAVLTDARISNVISSMNNSFKIGNPENIIGIVTQDRPQGIGGRLGRFAPAASVVISLSDIDAGRSYKRAFQIVQDKYLLSNLASPAIVGCIEDLWGRIGAGSAKVTASYSGGALRGGWKRTNIFIS